MTTPFSYDVFAYQSHAVPVMHPDRLFVQGRLFGLDPARPDACRYLEVGAGSGTNVIAAALHLPGSQFVGIDLAESAVAEGNEVIAALGLTNVRLEHADLTRWQPDGPFDYVAAHGVYSWVPAPVRDALLDLYRRALAPTGVGYVSYNTLPGCHLRRTLWDMMKFHTAGTDDPLAKLDQADQLLQFLCEGQEGQNDPPNRWLLAEAESVLRRNERYLTYHDDLATINDPVYFLDFAGHANRLGLKFFAEAALPTMSDEVYPAGVTAVLNDMGRRNPLLREQYRDFLKVRRFRSSLVCHAAQPSRPEPELADGLYAVSIVRPVGDPADGEPTEYVTDSGGSTTVADPLGRRLLAVLAQQAPVRVAVADLTAGEDPAAVRAAVLTMARAGLVTLYGLQLAGVRTAGERPTVSALARLQAGRGQPVSSQLHTTLDLSDSASLALLPLLDGTRTRAELTAALHETVPTLGTPEEVADGLEITLDKLARAGMLVQ